MKSDTILLAAIAVVITTGCAKTSKKEATDTHLKESSLFVQLPDSCPTPDGMSLTADGRMVLACPNYAEPHYPGILMIITKDGQAHKWTDVPVHPQTGIARPMGIAIEGDTVMYVCDNQGWSGEENLQNKGRVLKLKFDSIGSPIREVVTIATGMEHPNGVRLKDGYIYVTQSCLSAVKSDKLVSGIYRFRTDDKGIEVTNTLDDPNLITTVITENPEVQYGLDGLVFDKAGNLYVGNFGDAVIHKITMDAEGKVLANEKWACDTTQLKSTDGLCIDSDDNIYVADFSANAIARVTPDGKVTRIAQSPDCDGSDGGLDQPGEPIVWDDELIVSCFDAVTDPGKVNTKHDAPHTLSKINLK